MSDKKHLALEPATAKRMGDSLNEVLKIACAVRDAAMCDGADWKTLDQLQQVVDDVFNASLSLARAIKDTPWADDINVPY